MKQDIYIGVDGGGTKTKVRVEDNEGNVLGQAVSGSANIRLSVDMAWQSIYSALEEVLASQGMRLDDKQYYFHLGLGLAGFELKDSRQVFLNHHHPFKTILLNSDAHASCVGAHQGRDGAIIIVGTGVVGYQIQADAISKVSGWGFPHDDLGGGAWLGLEAARLTFQWLDRRVEKSPLVEDVFAFFNNDLEFFVKWANSANSKEFARLAPLVINHSQQEEVIAVRLMKKAAQAVERVNDALIEMRKENHVSFPVCLFGGIAPFIESWLSEELRSSLVSRSGDACTGAILMVRNSVQQDSKVKQAC